MYLRFILIVLGNTSKKNMYQAINSAMDSVLSKDPNSGNLFLYLNIPYSKQFRYIYLIIFI